MIGLILLLALPGAHPALQDTSDRGEQPVTGILWQPPAELPRAQADLRRIRDLGADAVRTPVIRREALLETADTLGLALYQELAVEFLPAGPLVDSTEAARSRLSTVLERARGHPSARHFGLARSADTSAPRSCGYLEALARTVRASGPPGSRVYYATWFLESDACASAVDFVLLTGPGDVAPRRRVERWRVAHPNSPAGLGEVGTWVDTGRTDARSAERALQTQARYLENHLRELTALAPPPHSIFVRRWRDPTDPASWSRERLGVPASQQRGIVDRPAEEVVRGFFTGVQRVFAFSVAPAPVRSPHGRIVLGWLLVLGTGLLYALSPRVRKMIPRYFLNHRFYQDAVRRGREVIPVESTALLLLICGATGLSADVIARSFDGTRLATVVAAWASPALRFWLSGLLENLWALIVLTGGLAGLTMAIWAAWSAFLTRHVGGDPLTLEQTFMLIIWSHWPLLGVGAGAWLLADAPRWSGTVIAAAGLCTLAAATIRVGRDLAGTSGLSGMQAALLGLTSPPCLAAFVLFFLATRIEPYLSYLLHLFLRA